VDTGVERLKASWLSFPTVWVAGIVGDEDRIHAFMRDTEREDYQGLDWFMSDKRRLSDC